MRRSVHYSGELACRRRAAGGATRPAFDLRPDRSEPTGVATPPGFAPSWRSAKPSVFERFLNEVQITAQLEHPNIVPIYGLEVAPDGAVAYAMKLVRGRELRKLVLEARGRRSW